MLRREDGSPLRTVAIENPCDPDRPRRTGTGLGLANVRARLGALYGDNACMSASETNGVWRTELTLPLDLPGA